MMKPTISIILPIFNEQNLIRGTLTHLISLGAYEMIVVDGGSTDGTCHTIQEEFPQISFLQTLLKNRALQMNLGAQHARSEVLLFVHADMNLSLKTVDLVGTKIQEGFVGGGFTKRYFPSNGLLNLYSFCLNMVGARFFRSFAGTNALFVRKQVFQRMGGFKQTGFLEDIIFSRDLKKQGRVAVIGKPVTVSPRRYLAQGILKQISVNAKILFLQKFFNQDPGKLRVIYERSEKKRLVIFVKYPTPGKVKTRLAERIGPDSAAKFYKKIAELTVRNLKTLASASLEVVVCYDPAPEKINIEKWLGDGLIYRSQSGGNLGDRLTASVKEAFQEGCDKVIIVGTDCPGLDAATVRQAFDKLFTNDLVIGPAVDGGYYLIGLSRYSPAVFKNISWSTDRVFEQTVQRVMSQRLSYTLLEEKMDIDTVSDYDQFMASQQKET